MFQFVYPKRYPALHKLNFEALMLLAEAAEKYEVFALINSCEFCLRNFLNQHPLTILDFAARHDYRSIVEELAMILVDTPMTDLTDLHPQSSNLGCVGQLNLMCHSQIQLNFT
ncbi:hypothetical protein DFJ43DRAFT_117079 [Lentinula guzmanii]|uniref:BTB domain-containing protein n=1 Tax=Lentinula guzmanii TaxID=2804957 RepID=A0AA38J2B6_9AGAR|nr:hypothetical protein DFJ43DRAFT_117079 [Lentinula guzmanii]